MLMLVTYAIGISLYMHAWLMHCVFVAGVDLAGCSRSVTLSGDDLHGQQPFHVGYDCGVGSELSSGCPAVQQHA